MKSKLSKEMRAIRVKLKLHSITDKEKEKLREDLYALKEMTKEQNRKEKESSK